MTPMSNYYAALYQDFKTLDKLSVEIAQQSNVNRLYSWLNPTQCSINDDLPCANISDSNQHIKCLQFIVDRLYAIINLINDQFEYKMSRAIRLKTCKNVNRPRKFTLGLSASVLWHKVVQLDSVLKDRELYKIETMGKSPTDHPFVVADHKATQIDTPVDLKCPSCSIAMKCLNSMSSHFSKLGHGTFINDARNAMHDGIFDMSQAESMDILSGAILEDFRELVETSEDIAKKLVNKTSEFDNLEYKFQCALKTVNELEEAKRINEQNALQDKDKRISMSKLINKLYHEKHRIENECKVLEKTKDELRRKIEDTEIAAADLRMHNDNLNKSLSGAVKHLEITSAEKELWKVRFKNAHEESLKLKSAHRELEEHTRGIQDNIDVIGGRCKELDAKITRSSEEIDDNTKTYERLLKKTQDVVSSTLLIEDKVNKIVVRCTNATEYTTNDDIVNGDPLIDMVKQVEINKTTIRKLEIQNEALLKTIRRFCQVSCKKSLTS